MIMMRRRRKKNNLENNEKVWNKIQRPTMQFIEIIKKIVRNCIFTFPHFLFI